MRHLSEQLLLSASDLITFLGCRHASALDRRALDEPDLKWGGDAPSAELLQQKGLAHERAYLDALSGQGLNVASVPANASPTDRAKATSELMTSGADIVYQAALIDAPWHGFADFLKRVEVLSTLGAYSYEVQDTKLARAVAPKHVVQLSIYSDLVAQVQGVTPEHMQVVLGDGTIETLRTYDFAAYVRHAQKRLETFLGSDERLETIAEPCGHCTLCHWAERCNEEWLAADHLSFVANIRGTRIEKLEAIGVTTMSALAALSPATRVKNLDPVVLDRLIRQARLQIAVRGTNDHLHELLEPQQGRGFARLPQPAEGDLFFDMEGDPLYEGGLEYLFGVHWGNPAGGNFRAFWAHDRAAEKRALQEFLDFVGQHLAQYPYAHIYHYNHYEVTAVRRLAMIHGTREAQVDDLLRHHKFVDLYKVVREGLLISEPRYSLKNIEKFYMPPREGDVASAGDSIVAYETWRETGDQKILDDIENYNAIDCRSTAALRDWLLSVRPADMLWFNPADVAPDDGALQRQREAEADRAAMEATLMAGAPEAERPFRQLVVDLVEFHRREQKPQWWALFDLQGREDDELLEDLNCLGGLEQQGEPTTVKRSLLHTFRFPSQETKIGAGATPKIIETLEPAGTIEAFDLERGYLTLKRAANKGPLPQKIALGPSGPINDQVIRDAIRRLADSVAAGANTFRAVEGILRRDAPRLTGHAAGEPIIGPGEDLVAGATRAALALDHSHLFIQGPPGAGKTYTASQMIVALLRAGKTIGVASNTHKAINNLLSGVEKAAQEKGVTFTGYKKCSKEDDEFDGVFIRNIEDNDIPAADLIAGTAWLFSRPEFGQRLDYLFVDEAGQVALANLTAMGTAARNIILVGDQMQLGQPIQGAHPGESGLSVLDYLLQGVATVPEDRGIFLNETRRMHPDVCGFISRAIYEDRLGTHATTHDQSLLLTPNAHPALKPTGISFVPMTHAGRSQSSSEEAERIREIWTNLMGQRWRDEKGHEQQITPEDVLIVAPYNAQVNLIADRLPGGARVGTVDRFQGQEAAVVLVSMTASSGDDIPRGIDFLFSRNRLNVAISRARCLAIILANPRLLEVPCATVEQMRLVNTLCLAEEWSRIKKE